MIHVKQFLPSNKIKSNGSSKLEETMLFFGHKKIAIFGMGLSGQKSVQFFITLNVYLNQIKNRSQVELFLIDQKAPSDWPFYKKLTEEYHLSPDRFFKEDEANPLMNKIDMIILAPGIARNHPLLQKVEEQNIPILSEIEVAYLFYDGIESDGPIIAITGTNGKTTTATLTGELLECLGYETFVGGNIGEPFLVWAENKLKRLFSIEKKRNVEKPLPKAIVLELSSFQLESLFSFHPSVAVLLNLSYSHQERYSDFHSYMKAKFKISQNLEEDDLLICKEYHGNLKEEFDQWVNSHSGQRILFNREIVKKELPSFCDIEHFKLRGEHNLENLYVSLMALYHINPHILESNSKMEILTKLISNFKGVKFRVELIENSRFKSYLIYNDAKSTNFESTISAIKSVQEGNNRPLHLIYGGKKRDQQIFKPDDSSSLEFLEVVKKYVKKIYLIGETTEECFSVFKQIKEVETIQSHTLDNVKINIEQSEKGPIRFKGILLFSPGFPSFDQFENYQARGELFNKLFSLEKI